MVAARAAAVAAVARTREVFEAGAISRRDVIAEFASARFAPELARRTSQQVVELLFGLREAEGRAVDVTLTSQPVTAQAHALSAERVAVDVWTVSVFVAEGQAAAAEQWSTVHLEMVRESGRWLVDAWDMTLGPVTGPGAGGLVRDERRGGRGVVVAGGRSRRADAADPVGNPIVDLRRVRRRRPSAGRGTRWCRGSSPGSPRACCC